VAERVDDALDDAHRLGLRGERDGLRADATEVRRHALQARGELLDDVVDLTDLLRQSGAEERLLHGLLDGLERLDRLAQLHGELTRRRAELLQRLVELSWVLGKRRLRRLADPG